MRLIRSLLALYHSKRALDLQRRSDWHAERFGALRTTCRPAAAPMSAAELFLLASIVGVGLAGIWVGIIWRAA